MYIRTPNTPFTIESVKIVDNIIALTRHFASTQTFVCTLDTILSKTLVESKS
jgi:hypothetical protein